MLVSVLAGCGSSGTPNVRNASFNSSVFASCLNPSSFGAATAAPATPSSWEQQPSLTTALMITFTPNPNDRSIWSASDITAPSAQAAFFRSDTAAAKSAAQARKTYGLVVVSHVNAVIAFAGQPSLVQKELIAACMDRSLTFQTKNA